MFLVLSLSFSFSLLFFDIFAIGIPIFLTVSLSFSVFDDIQIRCVFFFYSRSDFYTSPLSALIRQRRRMVLPRRALSLFPALGRSRVYSVAIGVVPINTLEEARSRVLHFYPVKTNNFITPSKPDRAARLPFYTSHSGYAAQP